MIERIVTWLCEQLSAAKASGFVVGLSGGVDSATAAALAVRAVGPEDVLAVLMPCHSQSDDIRLGRLVADTLGIRAVTVDLGAAFDILLASLPATNHLIAQANIKPRLRMTTLYFLANQHDLLVLGTGNKSEELTGYFTKYGDGGVDLLPLGSLYKTQVWELARELGVPQEVIGRAPSPGLWPGQTDEGEMGITYRELDRILMMIERSEHKRNVPPMFEGGIYNV